MFALSPRCNHVGSGFKFYYEYEYEYVVTRGGETCILGSGTPPIPREQSFSAQFLGFSSIYGYTL